MQKKLSSSVRIFYPRYKREELLTALKQRLSALEAMLPLNRVVLFGSWARGKQTAFSDIDLLVIYVGSPREDAYKIVKRCLNFRGLEPHVYSEDEAEKMVSTLGHMTKEGVILFPEEK